MDVFLIRSSLSSTASVERGMQVQMSEIFRQAKSITIVSFTLVFKDRSKVSSHLHLITAIYGEINRTDQVGHISALRRWLSCGLLAVR
jgi:hypothetical protein